MRTYIEIHSIPGKLSRAITDASTGKCGRIPRTKAEFDKLLAQAKSDERKLRAQGKLKRQRARRAR